MNKKSILFLTLLFIIILIPTVLANCDAYSMCYWANNNGCNGLMTGSSNLIGEIQDLSLNYEGYFAFHTGTDVCEKMQLYIQQPREQAEANTLALYSNIVENRLELDALIASAYDQNQDSFDRLLITSNMTINESIEIIESTLDNPLATNQELEDVYYVSYRIITFYRNENPIDPQCIYGCVSNEDCNYMNNNYCDENILMHDEGICIDFICEINTSISKDCNQDDGLTCLENNVYEINSFCGGDRCRTEETLIENCSENNINEINTCTYDPDNNNYTLDFRDSFISTCDKTIYECTTGDEEINHECDFSCGAECEGNSDCNTTIAPEDECIGNDYYDYEDAENSCNDCVCTENNYTLTIYENDERCFECIVDEDCSNLTQDYCNNNNKVYHDNASCINNQCQITTTEIEDCNFNQINCSGTKVWQYNGYCEAAECLINESLIEDCNDNLFCNGQETCNAGVCQNGTAIDCSSNDLTPIETCTNNPDNNPLTYDYFSGFTSTCDEENDQCTNGTINLTHTCDVDSCGAECDPTHNCNNKCLNEVFYFNGSCDNCNCDYLTQDCNSLDSWQNTSEQWIEETQCTQRKQIKQEYYNYSCSIEGCNYTISQERWINTTNIRNKVNGTTCDDNLFCTVNDQCISGICVGNERDCSNNSIEVSTCDYSPDNNNLTFDDFQFTSTCNETLDICTEIVDWEQDIKHTCDINNCGAECESDSDCEQTNCSSLSQCYNGTYREYYNQENLCNNCLCTANTCNNFTTIITDNDGDGFDVECDNDCNDSNPNINPNTEENCYNTIDDNCDGLVDLDDPQCEGKTIVINEFESNPAGTDAGNEWVELYNPGDKDVVITGWILENSNGEQYTIGSTILSKGFYMVHFSTQWLNNNDEYIILKGLHDNEIDRTIESADDNYNDDRTWQRLPNGQDNNSDDDWVFEKNTKNLTNECQDNDNDGFYGLTSECPKGLDCNDNNASINPNAEEICDSIDNNCDGTIDSFTEQCGEDICLGNKTCESGTWTDCSSFNQDAGICAICDSQGLIAYDETQNNDCDDSIDCTIDYCLGIGICNNTLDNSYCDDGLFCNGQETCDASLGCQDGTAIDCSSNDLDAIETCTNYPDNNSLTWDYFGGFTSTCDETLDACTTSTINLTHTCDVNNCEAECDSENNCQNNSCNKTYEDYCNGTKLVDYNNNQIYDSTIIIDNCDNTCLDNCTCTNCEVDCSAPETNQSCIIGECGATCRIDDDCNTTLAPEDKCIGNDYYDYEDAENFCNDCTCTENNYTVNITKNDPRCVDCLIDNDCSNLTKDYCDDNKVYYDQGICVNYECQVNTTEIENCNLNKTNCSGTEVWQYNGYCESAECLINETLVEDCDDNLYCNGQETCNAGVCQNGTAIDCSSNDIAGIKSCTYDPDNNPFTLDFISSFTSTCDEASDSCTFGFTSITHTCNISYCGAECELNSDCNQTNCSSLSQCYNGTYRNYFNQENICYDCECTQNTCDDFETRITDNDGDGFDVECDNDCDDNNSLINPNATENCFNGIDDNCNGLIDSQDPQCNATIVINEFESNSNNGEWIELYNPSNEIVNISNWELWDYLSSSKLIYEFPLNTIINAKSFLVYELSSNKLNNGGDKVILKDNYNNTIDETIEANDQDDDNKTWQRIPNGIDTDSDDDWQFVESTFNSTNYNETYYGYNETNCTDNDNDGFFAISPECLEGLDCDDNNSLINPNATEICDNLDNDCDGIVDNFTEECGEDICLGNKTCESGTWTNCDSSNQDAGVCAICDSEGLVVYDETQDADCFDELSETGDFCVGINQCNHTPYLSSCGDGITQDYEICDYNDPQFEVGECTSYCGLYGSSGIWNGCRGNGGRVCAELVPEEHFEDYFNLYPRCVPNYNCYGLYFRCNERCPDPNEVNYD